MTENKRNRMDKLSENVFVVTFLLGGDERGISENGVIYSVAV